MDPIDLQIEHTKNQVVRVVGIVHKVGDRLQWETDPNHRQRLREALQKASPIVAEWDTLADAYPTPQLLQQLQNLVSRLGLALLSVQDLVS
jgi:hypothetical protein